MVFLTRAAEGVPFVIAHEVFFGVLKGIRFSSLLSYGLPAIAYHSSRESKA